MKKIKYLLTLLFVSVCAVQSAWADDVIANVTLKEKNSLSTEILAIQGIDDIKTVTHLTVTTNEGVQLGDEDWTTIHSMSGLVELDLSNASANAVPSNQFGSCPNLTIARLPKDLTTIGWRAFGYHNSIVTVEVPNTVTSIEWGAFQNCHNLENCDISSCAITEIPEDCFEECKKLNSFTIPSSVTYIRERAFFRCSNFSSPLPTGIKSIGSEAFYEASMQDVDVVIPEGASIGLSSFGLCNIRSIELPTTFYIDNSSYYDCSNLQEIILKSPTVVIGGSPIPNPDNVTLKVPSHLVTAYKSHPAWSKYKDVVAISPAVTDFTVNVDLNLSNSSMRMEETPNVFFTENASLTIAGSTAQAFNNYTASANIYDYGYDQKFSMILNEEADVTVNGEFKQRFYVGKSDLAVNRWNFLCLPFDFTVGDVTTESGQFVIRTYNGAKRNIEDSSYGNWSANLTDDAVVPAGTGFIIQASDETWVTFKAKADGTNYAFKKNSDEIQIPLAANNSNGDASPANTGWNMVGNPWQTYYNIHQLNYTAPFAIYNGWQYVTYSPSDDDYALRPFEAVFVQCPQGVTSMDFPATGRQMTSEVTSQNAARRRAAGNRLLLDIQVASNDQNDKTRLVVNNDATMDYEIGRDASKFFADGTHVPQIYSLGADGTQYAINERPADKGTLTLGILFASEGEYTISAVRNDIGQVILTDNETSIKTDLSQHSYTFDADAGTCEGRFTMAFSNTTGIHSMVNNETAEKEIYTLDGVKVGNTTGLKKGVYVVRQGQHTQKVIIK